MKRVLGIFVIALVFAASAQTSTAAAPAPSGSYFIDCVFTPLTGPQTVEICTQALAKPDDNSDGKAQGRRAWLLQRRARGYLIVASDSMAAQAPGYIAKAMADCDEALALKPDRETAGQIYYLKSLGYLLAEDPQQATKANDLALVFDPDNKEALMARASSRQAAKDYTGALADFDRVATLAASNKADSAMLAEALNDSCWTRAAYLGTDLPRAREECTRAIAIKPDGAAYDSRGLVGLREGNFGLALQDYSKAAELAPTLASPLFGRGISKIRLGKTAEGRADINRALKLDPAISEIFRRTFNITP